MPQGSSAVRPTNGLYLFYLYVIHGAESFLRSWLVLQLVNKFPAFDGTRKFITVPTSARHFSLSWANSIQSPQPLPTSWRSILILSSNLRLGRYWVCVCSLMYPACALLCFHLWPVQLYHIFPHYVMKGTIFEGKFLIVRSSKKNAKRYYKNLHIYIYIYIHVKLPYVSLQM